MHEKKLSILIPVFNEAQTLEEIVRRVLDVCIPCTKEIIIVDDCSTDGTPALIKKLANAHPEDIHALFQEQNRGKGAAIRRALEKATGEIAIIQDADLEYDPTDYPKLLEPIFSGYADVVFGNRFHGGPHRVLYFWHWVGNQVLTMLSNALTNLNLSDMEVGYKAFRTDIVKRLKFTSDRFGFEPEFTAKVARLGCRIYEVPISYHGRTYEEGKKIGWSDAVVAFYCLIRYRFFD